MSECESERVRFCQGCTLPKENDDLKATIAAAAKIAKKKVYRQPDKMMLRELLGEEG